MKARHDRQTGPDESGWDLIDETDWGLVAETDWGLVTETDWGLVTETRPKSGRKTDF